MDISVLHEFVHLAETCNFQTTADELAMTQSTLSKHIHKLEEELGIPLFDRTTRSVTLNTFGIQYLNYARQICEISDQGLAALDSLKRGKRSKLNIGFMEKHGMYGLVEAISDFGRKHPEIKVNIIERNGDALKDLLVSGKADVIFYAEKMNEKEFRITHFTTDRLVAVLSVAHPLANADAVSLQDLAGEELIEHKTFLEMRLLSEACREAHVTLNYVTSIYHASTIMKMIREGIGVSIMSRGCAMENADADLVVVPIVPAITFDINVVSSRNRNLSQAADIFIKYIRANHSDGRIGGS
ncbi:MAG: LysR family transcriptional regulator [Oscillospiraceae bacterium]|nr:LysR family transcriptional regulator [Oscillospiraceae bacterium]